MADAIIVKGHSVIPGLGFSSESIHLSSIMLEVFFVYTPQLDKLNPTHPNISYNGPGFVFVTIGQKSVDHSPSMFSP